MKSFANKSLAKWIVFVWIAVLAYVLVGCGGPQGITLDIKWYALSRSAGLVPAEGEVIPFTDARVEEFAALHITDITELREALRRANIGESRFLKAAIGMGIENPNTAARDAVRAFDQADKELRELVFRILRNQRDSASQ